MADAEPRPDSEDPWVPMRIDRVIVRDQSDQQWIYLAEVDGDRGFPIVIGSPEAREIQRVVTGARMERPLTHQLAHASIEALDARLERVDITDLRNNTFFARLVLSDAAGALHEVDARPSDAVCLGLRAGCGIRVAESVLEQVRTDASGPDPLPEGPQGQTPEGEPEPDEPGAGDPEADDPKPGDPDAGA